MKALGKTPALHDVPETKGISFIVKMSQLSILLKYKKLAWKSEAEAKKETLLSTMYQKQRGLAFSVKMSQRFISFK